VIVRARSSSADYRASAEIRNDARAVAKTGLDITPKDLRDWFNNEMMRLGVSESYINAFCGRIPRSVLQRNYVSYNPKKLEEIYDKANLSIFS